MKMLTDAELIALNEKSYELGFAAGLAEDVKRKEVLGKHEIEFELVTLLRFPEATVKAVILLAVGKSIKIEATHLVYDVAGRHVEETKSYELE